mmetsp:Transcript_22236/g.72080  ORF Transcript_22236/g.72080 Transcript_22236/m.72080 type:complete len:242 (-) Transcript_22236:256-981(-)
MTLAKGSLPGELAENRLVMKKTFPSGKRMKTIIMRKSGTVNAAEKNIDRRQRSTSSRRPSASARDASEPSSGHSSAPYPDSCTRRRMSRGPTPAASYSTLTFSSSMLAWTLCTPGSCMSVNSMRGGQLAHTIPVTRSKVRVRASSRASAGYPNSVTILAIFPASSSSPASPASAVSSTWARSARRLTEAALTFSIRIKASSTLAAQAAHDIPWMRSTTCCLPGADGDDVDGGLIIRGCCKS